MKSLIFIYTILIVLFQTGNVLSDKNIFNVNNIEISGKTSENKEKLVNKAFQEAFDKLIQRLLLEEDYRRLSGISLVEIKKLISYYQIKNKNKNKNKNIEVNVFFDKTRMHNLFYNKDILYSDIISTDVIIFPLLKVKEEYFIYTKNYFYDNWNKKKSDNLIQYILPSESIENIQKINLNKKNIYKLDISDFFKEYEINNIIFAYIEINKDNAEVFLNSRIEGKKINKSMSINKKGDLNKKEFYEKIIVEINSVVKDLIKSQNLIDVRTPSFLNVKIQTNKRKSSLVEFNDRLEKIDLINSFYVQQLNKDYILIKIKYLGKIDKIIKKLKDQNINLKMISGEWQLSLI